MDLSRLGLKLGGCDNEVAALRSDHYTEGFHCDVMVDLGNGELTNDVPFFAVVKGRDSLPDLEHRALFDALTVHQIEGASRVVAA